MVKFYDITVTGTKYVISYRLLNFKLTKKWIYPTKKGQSALPDVKFLINNKLNLSNFIISIQILSR